jgi:hypothetical protein
MLKFAPVLVLALAGAASADVIVKATTPNGRALVLHDTDCPKSTPESRRGLVELLAPSGERMFAGCYAFNRTDETVEVEWEDGDTSTIPVRAIMKKPTGMSI